MLLLVATAHAHPGTLPHVHATDPIGLGVVAFWLLVGTAFCYFAAKPSFNAEKSATF